jgi:hypothetical protein
MAKKTQPSSRIATLRERIEETERKRGPSYDVPFRGKQIPLRKIQIDTDFPLYRIQSGRTHRAQCAYIEEHRLQSDFFDDPEDPKVQAAQHAILLRMIAEEGLDEDLKHRGQRAPLVLTTDGYVVDGNRRLAALREQKEQYVDAVVLPQDAQSRDIYETEIELQMQRETKAEYNWIDQALHIEYGIRELEESIDTVAKRMRMTRGDVSRELQKLTLVRQYLTWLGEENQYHRVPNPSAGGSMEQAFNDMARSFATPPFLRTSAPQKRVVHEACFDAIKNEAGYTDIRTIIKHLTQNPTRIAQRLREQGITRTPSRRASRPEHKPQRDSKGGSDDPLKALAGGDELPGDMSELLDIIGDKDAAPKVREVIEQIVAEERESKRQQQPLQRMQHALNDLRQVELSKDTDGFTQVAKTLEFLQKEIDRLVHALERFRA